MVAAGEAIGLGDIAPGDLEAGLAVAADEPRGRQPQNGPPPWSHAVAARHVGRPAASVISQIVPAGPGQRWRDDRRRRAVGLGRRRRHRMTLGDQRSPGRPGAAADRQALPVDLRRRAQSRSRRACSGGPSWTARRSDGAGDIVRGARADGVPVRSSAVVAAGSCRPVERPPVVPGRLAGRPRPAGIDRSLATGPPRASRSIAGPIGPGWTCRSRGPASSNMTFGAFRGRRLDPGPHRAAGQRGDRSTRPVTGRGAGVSEDAPLALEAQGAATSASAAPVAVADFSLGVPAAPSTV